MKVTNGEVRLMKDALEKLIAIRTSAKMAFQLAKLTNEVNEHFQVMEIARNGLVKQYGTERADGRIEINDSAKESKEEFWAEFVKLLEEEVEIDIEPIELPETLEVEPSTLMPLMRFIEVK